MNLYLGHYVVAKHAAISYELSSNAVLIAADNEDDAKRQLADMAYDYGFAKYGNTIWTVWEAKIKSVNEELLAKVGYSKPKSSDFMGFGEVFG